ncbi:helix-turn-helix transcriptional regulator [Duganella sp. Dugasp56]|uniref:helix-turn-helix transcriptional regulator n=1 Tax=Duganella sp. Dugasp56 TaxID=3243046 RepID=UPI0039B11F9A
MPLPAWTVSVFMPVIHTQFFRRVIIFNQLLTVKQVASMLCMSTSHVWAQVNDAPDFPKPFKLSAKQTRWKLSEVDAYIDIRSATRH